MSDALNNLVKYYIQLSHETQSPITNLKLQKLVYYTQSWNLAINKNPIFDEDFEAWVHGPVIRELYFNYQSLKWNPISEEISDSIEEILSTFEDNIKAVIEEVTESYFGETAYELERLTHNDSPWIEARGGIPDDERSENIITKESMHSFYSKFLK